MSGIFGSQGPQPPARPFGLGAGTPSRFPYPDRPQPAPGVGPGASQVIRARIVIISGPGAGIFIYSPVPGPGNLIGSWAGTAGTDQFGNAYPQGINITKGAISGSTFTGTGSSGEILVYTGTPALGNLLATVSGANGTDAQGNAFKAGLAVYDGTGGFIQITESGNVGIINFVPGTATHVTKAANLLGAVVNPGAANEYEALQIQSGAAGGHNVTTVQLLSDSADGTLTGVIKFFYQNTVVMAVGQDAITANAPIYLATDTPPTPGATVIYEGGTGHALYKDSSGAVYDMGRITAHASNGSLGQTINAVAFTLINGMSVNVGVGIYRFKVVVDLTTAAAAGRWELALGGTATTSTVDYSFFWVSGAGVAAGAVHQTNITTTQLGPNPSVIGPYHATYEGIVRFTSSGTFTVTAATTVAADTFTVWDGSTMTCDPIV